jgi:hypothetical protein
MKIVFSFAIIAASASFCFAEEVPPQTPDSGSPVVIVTPNDGANRAAESTLGGADAVNNAASQFPVTSMETQFAAARGPERGKRCNTSQPGCFGTGSFFADADHTWACMVKDRTGRIKTSFVIFPGVTTATKVTYGDVWLCIEIVDFSKRPGAKPIDVPELGR